MKKLSLEYAAEKATEIFWDAIGDECSYDIALDKVYEFVSNTDIEGMTNSAGGIEDSSLALIYSQIPSEEEYSAAI